MSAIGQRVCGVYEIRHTESDRRYVGSSVNIMQRWAAHRSNLKYGKHHSVRLQRAWTKYGPDAFEHRILLVCAREHLQFYEKIAIEAFDAYRTGLNGAPTPYSGIGRPLSEEAKAKLSEFWKGRKKTPEHRAAIAAGNIGKRHSEASIEKMRKAKAGKKNGPLSEAHRQKLSEILRGRPKSPEQIEKMRAFRHTEESKRKVSESKTGQTLRPRDPGHTRRQQESKARTLAAKREAR